MLRHVQASTIIGQLVQQEKCSSLVEALVARCAALGPAAVLGALEADGTDAYRRLVERTGLSVGEAEVEALLAVPEGGGEARWTALVLQERKRLLVEELIGRDERLRLAAARALSDAVERSAEMDADDTAGEGQESGEEGGEDGEGSGGEEEENEEEGEESSEEEDSEEGEESDDQGQGNEEGEEEW